MADNVQTTTDVSTLPDDTIIAARAVTYSGDSNALIAPVGLVAFSGNDDAKTATDIPGDNINGLDVDVTRVGGNVATTVADGANVTLGAKADAAATTDAGTFSLMGLFKRLLEKITTQFPAALSNGFFKVSLQETSVTQTVSGTVSATQSGTWTVQPGNTANTTAWKVDGSAVTQPVSAASLPLPTGASTLAEQQTQTTALQLIDDIVITDDAAFTPATSKVAMVGAEFDDTTPDSVNEGDAGALRMSANRNLYNTIRDAAGNERGVNVTAGNALTTDGSATTQPISAASLPLPTGAATSANQSTSNTSLSAIQTAVELIDNAVAGNELQVDVITMPTVTVTVSGAVDTELTTADLDTGAGTDTRAVVGLVGSASGGGALIPGSATDGLLVNLGTNNDVTVTGSVTSNAGTNLNTSALALEAGGNLAGAATSLALIDDTIATDGAATPTKGVLIAGQDGTNAQTIKTDTSGELQIDVLTVPAPLSTTGGGTEATALRVTIASDSTGLVSIDDNGGSLTVDAASLPLPTGAATLAEQQTQTTALTDTIGAAYSAEDIASLHGDKGVVILARRTATPANTSGTDGDYEVPQMSAGRLWASATIDAALPAGTNAIGKLAANSGVDIGDVDITSIAAGDNNIGNVDVVTLPALAAGSNNIGDVDVLTIAAGDNNIGNVDIVTMPNVTVGTMANLTESLVDDAAFTPATSRVVPIGFEFDDTTPDSVNEGDVGAARMSANRNIYTTIRDAAGNERGANVTAGSALVIDGSAVTQPVSAASLPLPTGAATLAEQQTQTTALQLIDNFISGSRGLVTEDNSAAIKTSVELIDDTIATLGTTTYTEATTKGAIIGAVRRDADTTLVDTTNEVGPLQMDANGRLKVEAFSGETLPVSLTSTTVTGTVAVTQSGTWDEVGINDSGNSITVDNAGTFAVQESGGALTALQLIDNTILVDDAAFTPATSSVSMAGFQADEATTDSVDEGDAGAARMTLDRKVIVTPQPHTSGGLSVFNATSSDGATALTSTAQAIKASAGKVYGWYIYNPNSTAQFVQLYNTAAASVTVGTTNPLFMLTLPATAAANVEFSMGIDFTNAGFSCAATSTAGGNGAPTTALDAVIFYK